MASLRSQLFIFIIKYNGIFRFKLKRQAPDTSVPGVMVLREKTSKPSRLFGKLPAGIKLSEVAIGNLYAEWLEPVPKISDKVILYFHGGGYVLGSAQGHRVIVSKFVQRSRARALVFNYGLAPEHPFPEGLNDAIAAYRYLLDSNIKPEDIVFIGDSAGGGLCLATLLAVRDKNIPLPSAAIALSPWTDLKNTGDSLKKNLSVDALTWRESWVDFSKYYVGKEKPENPLVSPLYGDLRGFPPLLIYAGNDELLRDDSTRFAEKAKAAGVTVTLRVGKGMFHCYPVCAPIFPEATEAMNEICQFINGRR